MLPFAHLQQPIFVANSIWMINKVYFNAITAVLFFCWYAVPAFAQDSVKRIGLTQAIEAAIANNSNLRQAQIDEKIITANYQQTQSVFLPQVALSYTAISSTNPLNAFGFKLQQGAITANDFNPTLLNNPKATPDFMTKLEAQQPIINLDMLYARKGVAKQINLYRYKTERTKDYITFEVQKAYLQLQLAYNGEQVLTEALHTAQSVYTFTNNRLQQGLIQKSDLLNAEVQVTNIESNLSKARSNIRNASDYLSLLMGVNPGRLYSLKDSVLLTLTDTLKQAGNSRADFMAMGKAIEAQDLMIKASQMTYLPRLNAFGNFQYNDHNFAGFGANAYLVGIQLTWDVFKGNRTKNTITVQKLERDKLSEQLQQQKDQSRQELNKAYRDLNDAQFEMAQQKVAIAQAAEALRILQNRYQQGLVNTTDVLMAQTQLLQQKFGMAQAQFTYKLSTFYIQLLTSTTNK